MATGQVLLAALPTALRQRTLASLPLPVRGPQTLVSAVDLEARLRQVAAAGWCVCRNQAGEHLAALAVPVRDVSGEVRAALGISLPEVRLSAEREVELLEELRQARQVLEADWGWRE
jgi:DNA-binding IclR family transcriptional regulator